MTAPTLAVIEMKYGDGALKGDAGIVSHLEDFKIFAESADVRGFCEDQSDIFRQKCELGLIPDMADKPHKHKIQIQTENMEIIFLLANHDPDSKILKEVVSSIDPGDYGFPIKFCKASMMGYCLYEDNMMSLEDFKKYLRC